jgi:phosphopantothenate---cysteine ligase (CTP)
VNLLVTAGNTQVPIDKVRCLTNIFTGRTGTRIALDAHTRGHAVTLLTSHPEVVAELSENGTPRAERWTVRSYHTFDDLHGLMAEAVRGGSLEGIIHSAAVSDYRSAGIFAPAPGTRFRAEDGRWEGGAALADRAADKVKSDEPELWLRLVRTPKLIDRVRTDWGFGGMLVKFKLEVGVSEEQLLEVAERSRRQSAADLMVANTLEGAASWAYLGPLGRGYERVSRRELAGRLLDAVEALPGGASHG